MSDLPPDVAARLERARQDAIRASREGALLTRRPLRPEEEPSEGPGVRASFFSSPEKKEERKDDFGV